jgi:hypothetical protein
MEYYAIEMMLDCAPEKHSILFWGLFYGTPNKSNSPCGKIQIIRILQRSLYMGLSSNCVFPACVLVHVGYVDI